MRLKRKTFVIILGIVAAQLSIAQFFNSSSPQRFGDGAARQDCATCASARIPYPSDPSTLPLNQNLMLRLNAFVYGNAVAGTASASQTQGGSYSAFNPWQTYQAPVLGVGQPAFYMPVNMFL